MVAQGERATRARWGYDFSLQTAAPGNVSTPLPSHRPSRKLPTKRAPSANVSTPKPSRCVPGQGCHREDKDGERRKGGGGSVGTQGKQRQDKDGESKEAKAVVAQWRQRRVKKT